MTTEPTEEELEKVQIKTTGTAKNLYDTMFVERTCKDEDLDKSMKKLYRRLHPDVNIRKESDARQRFLMKKMLQLFQGSYDLLKNHEKRKKYDIAIKYLPVHGSLSNTDFSSINKAISSVLL